MNNRPTFLNSGSDCTWLRETHLKPGNVTGFTTLPPFKSFVLIGNEDCPSKILLHKTKNPVSSAKPIAATLCEDGRYSFTVPGTVDKAHAESDYVQGGQL